MTRMLSVTGWLVLFGALFAWEGFGLRRADDDWLTFSSLVELVRWPLLRWVMFALWLWFGWHVFVRTWQILPGK